MKAVIGLGNPGREYELTRHNAGFMVVDNLLEAAGAGWSRTRYKGVAAKASWKRTGFLAAKPDTYMNRSGHFVSPLLNYYRVDPTDLLVVHDEMDLPLGRIRLARGGGSAGHRGIQSIIEQLGNRDFSRLRIGVGKPEHAEGVVGHVLSRFSAPEWTIFNEVVETCVTAIGTFLAEGIDAAMNQHNSFHVPWPTKGGE